MFDGSVKLLRTESVRAWIDILDMYGSEQLQIINTRAAQMERPKLCSLL